MQRPRPQHEKRKKFVEFLELNTLSGPELKDLGDPQGWKAKFGGMELSDMQRLKALEPIEDPCGPKVLPMSPE